MQKFDKTAVKTNNWFQIRLLWQKKNKLQDEIHTVTENNNENQLYWGISIGLMA